MRASNILKGLSLTPLLLIQLLGMNSTAQTSIRLNPALTFQTIDGWEATCNTMEVAEIRDTLLPHLDKLIDLAVNDLGITRLRFGMGSGMENPVDYFKQTIDGSITYDSFKTKRYTKINDNSDPFVSDPSGFQMTRLDDNLEYLILPFKKAVENRGDPFYLNMCFVDFTNQSPFHHTSNPEEYAEFMSYIWSYMDSTHGFVPDGLEVILEPDNAAIWDKKHIPGAISATGKRLAAQGFYPEFIAPSVLNLRNIPAYMQEIAKDSAALSYMDVICYHRYSGGRDTAAQEQIVALAKQYQLKTAMLEYDHNGGVNELHYDLLYNNVVAWTKYALAYKSNEPFAYVYVDARDWNNPVYGIGNQTRYLRQYFKYIRPGAVRFEALSDSGYISPVAFRNSNGTDVVVVKAERGDSIVIHGLEAGDYGIKYTLGNYDWRVAPKVYDFDLPDQSVTKGQALGFRIPEKGIATVYGLRGNVGLDEVRTKPVSIYPNPVRTFLQIQRPTRNSSPYYILNLQGECVQSGLLSPESSQINVSNLEGGFYILRTAAFSARFVKE